MVSLRFFSTCKLSHLTLGYNSVFFFIFKFFDSFLYIFIKKLINTYENTDGKILLIYYDYLYQQNFSFLYLSVNINRKILSVHIEEMTEGIIVRLKRQIVHFNFWFGDRPSSSLPTFFLFPYVFFSVTNNHPLIST